MRILTNERQAISVVQWGAGGDEIDQLDFRLGADEGVLINAVESILMPAATAADVNWKGSSSLSLNADHTAADIPLQTDMTDIDSPFIFIHWSQCFQGVDDGAGGRFAGRVTSFQSMHWYNLSPAERPKSNDILVHLVDAGATLTGDAHMLIRYQLVQFSLQELGVLNAYRRY